MKQNNQQTNQPDLSRDKKAVESEGDGDPKHSSNPWNSFQRPGK